MKNTRIAKIALQIAVVYFSFVGLGKTTQAQPETRFRLVHDTVIVISMTANNQGPFDFILDTGTNSTILDPSVARQLQLVPLDRIQLSTLGGTQTVVRSSLRTLAVGSAEVENVEVLTQDLSEVRKVDSHIQGIVGQNFLSHFNYLIDYRKRSFQIESTNEIRNLAEGDQFHMEVSDNKMIVASEAQSRGTAKLRLLLDSGANMVTLAQKASQALDASARQSWLQLTSNGQVGMQVGQCRSLTVGSEKFRDVTVALADAQSSDSERVEDGVLPTALFRTLYINNQEGFVIFNPRIKKN